MEGSAEAQFQAQQQGQPMDADPGSELYSRCVAA